MPTLAAAHYNLGILLQRQNELDRALQEYQLALKYASDEREAAQTHTTWACFSSNSDGGMRQLQSLRTPLR